MKTEIGSCLVHASSGGRSRDAFTRWEMLVVLVMVVLLLAVNLPGLAQGNRRSERVHCLNNLSAEVFLVRLGEADGDLDGIDDDWELAYFETLDRDGTGDWDEDGQTDRNEFAAGTDPTNEDSIFRVLTLQRPGPGEVVVLWASVPDKVYQVEYADDAGAPNWLPVGEPVTATEITTSVTDTEADSSPRRFYRVRLVP